MKRYYIIYKGIVQGVGFRWKLMNTAYKYNLTGYAKNLDNGDVLVEVQGNGVDEFLKESISKDRFIEIYDYALKQIPTIDDENSFNIKY